MNRSEQNRAIRDLDEMASTFLDFQADARLILLRNRFSTGERHHVHDELGEMAGHDKPFYGDPTGEEAVWDERDDEIGKAITKMADDFHHWVEMVKWMKGFSRIDVKKRAEATNPDCLACGKPCNGKIVGGFCERCQQKWSDEPRPRDRTKFIHRIKAVAELMAEEIPGQHDG